MQRFFSPEPVYFTSANTGSQAFRQSFIAWMDDLFSERFTAGANWGTSISKGLFGFHNPGVTTFTYLRDLAGNHNTGDTLTTGKLYEVQLDIDFGTPGGLATLSYRNISDGETSFTVDSTIADHPMSIVADGSGRYGFNAVGNRNDGSAATGMFSYSAGIVPEPSWLVLAISGLLALTFWRFIGLRPKSGRGGTG